MEIIDQNQYNLDSNNESQDYGIVENFTEPLAEFGELRAEQIPSRLSNLAPSPLTLSLAYTTLDLSSLDLYNILILENYPHIVNINLSNNNLLSLNHLKNMKSLTQLRATHNNLVKCFDIYDEKVIESVTELDDFSKSVYEKSDENEEEINKEETISKEQDNNEIITNEEVNQEETITNITDNQISEQKQSNNTKDTSFPNSLDVSMLSLVDLSYNNIDHIGELSQKFKFLETLILSNNLIYNIDEIHSLQYLKCLDLSYNKLTSLKALKNLPNLQELNVSNNDLITLDDLFYPPSPTNPTETFYFPSLISLDISYNKIKTLKKLENVTTLVELNVSHNEISIIRQVEFLLNLPYLFSFSLINNPCALKEYYRLRVIYRLRNLRQLDGLAVTPYEKIDAFNLYRSPEGDLTEREEAHNTTFTSYSLPYYDYSPLQLEYDEELEVSYEELCEGYINDSV